MDIYTLYNNLPTPILRPYKMNNIALNYIGPKLWNALPILDPFNRITYSIHFYNN